MKITRIKVSAYRGIEALDEVIPSNGAIAKGRNGAGKSSILNALRAALDGNDIGGDAVRNGHDRAEILIDVDHLQVKRAITKTGGGGLTVTQDIGNGARATIASPQTFLRSLLGSSALDPIELFTAKPKDRRAQILAALPVSVTVEQLRKWVPDLPKNFDASGHGLEVIAGLRKVYYDQRTVANAAEKKAAEAATRAKATADELASTWTGPTIAVEAAEAALKKAQAELAGLETRALEADAAEKRTAESRAKIAAQRSQADKEADGISDVPDADLQAAEDAAFSQFQVVSKLREQLEAAEDVLAKANLWVTQLKARQEAAKAARRRAQDLRSGAASLEAAISQASVARPSAEELATAEDTVERAKVLAAEAGEAAKAVAARTVADLAVRAAESAATEAARLDNIVTGLTNDAPAALLAEGNAIPGLTLQGEDVYLDGVRLEGLCGAEQLKFAVAIAKRANAKSKILICDGLERLDPEQLEDFLKFATADGWQILATRVDRGNVVLEGIEPDETPKVKGVGSAAAQVH